MLWRINRQLSFQLGVLDFSIGVVNDLEISGGVYHIVEVTYFVQFNGLNGVQGVGGGERVGGHFDAVALSSCVIDGTHDRV